jgi:hypothetical protein
MALLALAAIPGFIALAKVQDERTSVVESVTGTADRSLGENAAPSTLLSASSTAPAG